MQALTERITEYRRNGLTAIELGGGVHVEGDVPVLLSGFGGRFLVHNYFPPAAESFVLNLASSNENIRQRSMDLVAGALALSVRLKASFYSVHAGFITDPNGFGATSFIFPRPDSPEEAGHALERFISALRLLLRTAESLGLQILVENNVCSPDLLGKLLLQTAHEFLELFDALPNPQLGMVLDTGHLNISARTLEFDRLDFIERVASHTRAFHIHDNDGTADTHSAISPESWVLDMLRRPEFANLPIIVESKFETVTDLRRHVDWLKVELGRE